MPTPAKFLYECGPFLLDPKNHVLSRNGSPLPLPPKAFETLLILVEHRGNLVEKEFLLREVWPDTFVEENNLTQYISLLRKVLGDNADQRAYIETVPRFGYRFVARVREVTTEDEETPARIPESETVPRPRNGAGAKDLNLSTAALPAGGVKKSTYLLAAISVLAVVGVAFVLYRLWSPAARSRASHSGATRRAVAVLGFKNLARNPEADWLSTALVEMLNTELSAGSRLRTIPGEDVARLRNDLRITENSTLSRSTLTQVRQNLGADITVSGSFVEIGSGADQQIRLDIQLQDTRVGETIGSIAEVGTVSDLFQLVSRSGRRLRARLGSPDASSIEQEEIRAAMPSTPEAARLYSQGLSRLREFDAPAAQTLFTKALAIDPNYALGHSALAAAWSALGYDEKASAEAKRAFELSQNLSREERLLIAGRYREMSRQWDKAVETYSLLFSSFPDNVEYGILLMDAQTAAGKGRDAQATARQLRALPPPSSEEPQIDLAEASAQESLGAFKEEQQAAQTAERKGQTLGERLLVAEALVKQAWASSRLGQKENAIRALGQAKELFQATGDRQGVAFADKNIAGILTFSGDFRNARVAATDALKVFEQIGDKRGAAQSLNTLGIMDYEQGNLPQAKAFYERSLQIQREVGSKTNIAGALGNIANVLDAEGDLGQAQKLTEESIQVFTETGDQRALASALGNLSELLYEQGDLPRASKTYADALKIARTIGYQRGVGYDLDGLSQVAESEGDLTDARKKQEEALSIRNAIGEKHNAASSLLGLANLALDEGNASQAQTSAMQAAELLSTEKSSAEQAFGEIMLARCFAAQSRLSDAQNALKRAASLSRNSVGRPLRFELAIASAEVTLAQPIRDGPGSLLETQKRLQSALQEARRCGYRGYEFRLRLALDQLDARRGQLSAARSDLTQLLQDSKSKGFSSVSHKAEALLASTSSHP
jgi:DNA-binding winged helix-turn-helix (wHTH) protein/tetratricopeptide (TPR) repeat protein/TolB-like protein